MKHIALAAIASILFAAPGFSREQYQFSLPGKPGKKVIYLGVSPEGYVGYAYPVYANSKTGDSPQEDENLAMRTGEMRRFSESCYRWLHPGGARWEALEDWCIDTRNDDDMHPQWVEGVFWRCLNKWSWAAGARIFGDLDREQETDGPDGDGPDGKNEIMFGSISNRGIIAITLVWRGGPGNREIIEFDMIFDDDDFQWGDAGVTIEFGVGNPQIMDLENIATHEAGHAAGMDHPSGVCRHETMLSTSHEGETKKRTLHLGDTEGIWQLYSGREADVREQEADHRRLHRPSPKRRERNRVRRHRESGL